MLAVLVRAVLLYILVIFSLRMMGKRQLGELQPTELVITILISNIASLPIEDPSIPMMMGAVPILVLVGFELLVSNISLKSRKFRKFISGNPIVVISDGKLNQQALHELRFSIDDLMESLREQNIFNLEDVHFAIVETTGKVSVLQKYSAQNLTPEMIQLEGPDKNPPIVAVSDGKVIPESLARYGISPLWVEETLRKSGQKLKDIFLMTVNQEKEYLIIPKETGRG